MTGFFCILPESFSAYKQKHMSGCIFIYLKNGDDFPFVNLSLSERAIDESQGGQELLL